MVRDPQWHCCWERKIYFHCIINFHNLMSLALDNRFIYPAHMMRSLKVHPLSDQFCSVNGSTCRDHKNILTWFLYFFFFILNSIFNCTFLFLLQITCWHCSDFFFFCQVVLKFQFLFSSAKFCARSSVSINVISNIAQCAMTTWQSITSLISIIEIDELNTQVLYKPICLMVLFVECALKAVVSIITLY